MLFSVKQAFVRGDEMQTPKNAYVGRYCTNYRLTVTTAKNWDTRLMPMAVIYRSEHTGQHVAATHCGNKPFLVYSLGDNLQQ